MRPRASIATVVTTPALALLLAGALLLLSAPADATTVGYWRFEEGTADNVAAGAASILDETANNNDGSPVGNPVYRSEIPENPLSGTGAANALSLELDGSGDYVSIPHSASLDLSDGFTVEFWMKGNPSQPDNLYLVVDKSHGWVDATGWLFQGNSSTGQLGFGLGDGGGFPAVSSSGSLLDDVWHHVAGSYDSTDTGQELKFYIDGELEASGPAGGYATNTRPINIGASWGGGTPLRHFDGLVDEVRISDAVLVPGEFLLIPEPTTLSLLALGLASFGVAGRKRARGNSP
jgi:hypothetical protein